MEKLGILLFCCFLACVIQQTTGFTDRDVKGINKFVKNMFVSNPTTSIVNKIEAFPERVNLFGEYYRFRIISELMIPITRVGVEKGRYYYSSPDQSMVSSIWGTNDKVYSLKCGQKDPSVERRIEDIKDDNNITGKVMRVVNDTSAFVDGSIVQLPKEYKRLRVAQYSDKTGFLLAFNKAEDAYGYLYAVNLDSVTKYNENTIKPTLVFKDLEDSVKDIAVDQLTGNLIIVAGKGHSDFLLALEKIYPGNQQIQRNAKMMACPPVKECPVADCSYINSNGDLALSAMQNIVQRAGDMILAEYEKVASVTGDLSDSESSCSSQRVEMEKQAEEIASLKKKLEKCKITMDKMASRFSQVSHHDTGARALVIEEIVEEDNPEDSVDIVEDQIEE